MGQTGKLLRTSQVQLSSSEVHWKHIQGFREEVLFVTYSGVV
jgi:hypothetical protein